MTESDRRDLAYLGALTLTAVPIAGTVPTAAVGMILNSGQELDYTGDPSMISFVLSAGTPILDITYYA